MADTATGTQDDEAQARRQQFLTGMSFAACTVNVVTTDGPAGRAGVTVSAMSSVSAEGDRPTLLVCVHHMSNAAQAILDNGVFCVNVLRSDQSHISDSFAGRIRQPGSDKFAVTEWRTGPTGAPRVADGLVAFDCRLQSQQRIGTHHVFIGEVEEIVAAESGSPLIYANRAYGLPTQLPVAIQAPPETLRVGVLHTFAPYIVPEIVSRLLAKGHEPDLHLLTDNQKEVVTSLTSGEIDVALLYDFDLPGNLDVARIAAMNPYALLPERHPLAEKASLSLAELAEHPMVLLDAPPSADYYTSLFEAQGLKPTIRYRSSSLETVRGFVGHGLGYTLLTTKPAADMSYDGRSLTSRPLVETAEASHLALVTRKGAELPPPARLFAEVARAMFD